MSRPTPEGGARQRVQRVEVHDTPIGRAVDLLIAATAVAAEIPVYTRNPSDFGGLDGLLEVVTVGPA